MKALPIGAASISFLLSLCPLLAAADTLGVVVVADSPPGPELVELSGQLRSLVAERTQGVLEASELRERMGGPSSPATLPELERAYAGALASYQNGDFQGSVRSLRAIVGDLEKLPEGPEVFQLWSRVMLRLARSEQTLGHKEEARAALERLVKAAPNAKADPNQYPPSFEKQLQEVRADVRALPFRKLTVLGPAKGARVFLEGRDLGMAPVSVEVPAGVYRVSGTYGAVRVPPTTVDLSEESQTITLNFELVQALRPGFGPGLQLTEGDRSGKLVAAGAFLGLDRLLATSLVSDGGVEYLSGKLYDVRHGTLLREGRVRLSRRAAPGGSLAALAAFLITGQGSALVAAAVQAEPAPPRGEERALPEQGADVAPVEVPTRRWSRSRWGWVSVGSGAAVAALGAVFGMQARSAYDDVKKASAAGDLSAYESSSSATRSRARAADVCFGIGAAGAGFGTYLLLTGRPAALTAAPTEGGAMALYTGRF